MKYATTVGTTNIPQYGNRIRFQETKPGRISSALWIPCWCLRAKDFKKDILYFRRGNNGCPDFIFELPNCFSIFSAVSGRNGFRSCAIWRISVTKNSRTF